MSLYSGMYDRYMLFNDENTFIFIAIFAICIVFLVYSKYAYRKRMRELQRKLDAINTAQRKLISERGKLLREQYRY